MVSRLALWAESGHSLPILGAEWPDSSRSHSKSIKEQHARARAAAARPSVCRRSFGRSDTEPFGGPE